MKICSLCCDSSKSAFHNVETVQFGSEFIAISEMTKVFKDLEPLWSSKVEKNICFDCLQDLQSSYLFYKKCRKSKELFSETIRDSPSKRATTSLDTAKIVPFQCCDQRFLNRTTLNKHKQLVHGSIMRFVCRLCPKKFLTKRSVRIHEISHRKARKSPDLFCDQCQTQFVHHGTFSKHKERHDNDTVCYYCNRGFSEVDQTKKHIADGHETTDKRFGCVIMPETIREAKDFTQTFPHYRDTLTSHLVECKKKKSDENDEYWNIEHLIDDDLGTEWLNYEMLSDDYLNVDNGEAMVEEFLDDAFEMLAGQNEELKCHHCSTVFMTARDLVMHDITNHDTVKRDTPDSKPIMSSCYKCPRCQTEFTKQSMLTVHLAHDHGEFTLLCNECGTAYNDLSKLRAHRKEHQMENVTSSLTDPQNTRDGKSMCTLCDKYFTTNGLKYHLKTHSNVVPAFVCPFCDKKFIASTNLNAHIRIRHSETKRHPCSHCERRFATVDHLKKHTASVHLHIRNFKCDVCEKSFRQKSHLNQHLWQHSGGVKQYQCSLCIKAYTSKPSLRNHLLKVHSLTE
ncbi:hypothetical protein HA402_007569 [Bradysia odoriphaga]|nr:hypothetical protein HA402_007569 [Bradysia odoriphaga]